MVLSIRGEEPIWIDDSFFGDLVTYFCGEPMSYFGGELMNYFGVGIIDADSLLFSFIADI